MACNQKCSCIQRNRHLIISLMFLLISSLTHVRFTIEGREIPKEIQTSQEEKKLVVVERRSLIGSRPPRCERRCISCGHCEAIQVPILPQIKRIPTTSSSSSSSSSSSHHFSTIEYSRGDDISNYKPMSWKCKCGDFIFNP